MEILVVIAIFIIVCAIAYPIYMGTKRKAYATAASKKMAQLGIALTRFTSDHNGELPKESGGNGENSWASSALPDAADAWFNALPRLAGAQGTADYHNSGNSAGFYAKESILALEGVDYPKTAMRKPFYAYTYNTKLHRIDPKTNEKRAVNANKIANPSRVVALLEQGLKGEKRAVKTMRSYDGDDTKASGKQFVARWNDRGHIAFLDGHVELVKPEQILESTTGLRLKWNAADASGIFWTADPSEDPN